jgi:hypothetical protein
MKERGQCPRSFSLRAIDLAPSGQPSWAGGFRPYRAWGWGGTGTQGFAPGYDISPRWGVVQRKIPLLLGRRGGSRQRRLTGW